MLLRWFPMLRPRLKPGDSRFKHSLVRRVLIILLLTSLFPILLIGTINLFRSQALLRTQISNQLNNIASLEVQEMQDFVHVRDNLIDQIVTDKTFNDSLRVLLTTEAESSDYQNAQFAINYMFKGRPQTSMEGYYDNMLIVRADGSILDSTSDIWAQSFGMGRLTNAPMQGMVGKNTSSFVFSPSASYMNKLVLITARTFKDENGKAQATLLAVSSSDGPTRTLVSASSFIQGASSYIFTQQGEVIGLGLQNWLRRMPDNASITQNLAPLYTAKNNRSLFNGKSYQANETASVIAQWVPEYGIGLILLVPQQSLFQQIGFFDPFSVVVLLVSLGISGSLIYYSSTRLVRPLVHLANAVDRFSKGNWSERSNIHRSDEIGLLAFSFNRMAEELSQLYHSLEGVVERRTSQLRMASEVAQLATSTTKLSDALGSTASLIAERFGFYHVAIYLFDATGQSLTLTEASGISGEAIKQRGDRAEMNAQNIIGWVASNSQARIISKVHEDSLFRPDALLPDTMSEAAIPIIVGSEVLGVLDIQSTLLDAFDEETVAVFQTLANQISSTLQSNRLLETTQVSYQETNLLYRATRQITRAHSSEEIIESLTDAFTQLPYLGSVLSVEGENFHIQMVTDPKTGRVEKSLQSIKIPIGPMGQLLTENRIVLIENIAQTSDYSTLLSFLLRRQCKSAALISILEHGTVSKVIALGSREENQITQTRLQPYANLAEVIGAAIEKISVLHTLQQRLSELQILANFSQALSAETNLNNLYRVLHQQIIQTVGSDIEFAVASYDAKKEQVLFPYFYENGRLQDISPSKLGEGLTSQLILSGKPLFFKDDEANQSASGGIDAGKPPRSWMGIPLMFGGSAIGAVILQDLNNENRFTEDDLNLFLTLAPQIATSLRNTQLYTEAQQALGAYDQERFLLNTLLDNIPEGITFKDTHGRYIRTSSSVSRFLNISAEEIVGKTDYDLMDRDAAEKIFREEQMIMNIGKAEIGVIQYLVSKEGKESWMYTSRIPVRTSSGDPYGMLLIHRDVTDLKHAEALAQRRADQVLTAAEIARDTTGTLDVKMLLQKSVNLVRERFGFYHASIFLLDPANEYAILRESTGEAGRKMMQAGHRLAVGSKSIVGQVTSTGQPLIVNDVAKDPTHFPNPLLPETRSELGIPLKIGERILGVLDVQSTQVDAFNSEDVNVLRILADQMAVAVTNGELFAKTQELLGKHRLLRQITIAASTSTNLEDALTNVVSGLRTAMAGDRIAILLLDDDKMLHMQASAGYEGAQMDLRIPTGKGIAGTAAVEKRPILVNDTNSDQRYLNVDPNVRAELAIPILFSDEVIGVLNLESTHVAAFDENDQEILGALGNNLGGVIANIRLVNQIREQVVRERQLFEITSKIRRSVDLETILQTTTKEIARVLGARRARIEIKPIVSLPESENDQDSGLTNLLSGYRRNGKSSDNGKGQEA